MIINKNDLTIESIKNIIDSVTENNHKAIIISGGNRYVSKRQFNYIETENEEEYIIISTIRIKKSEMNKKYLIKCKEKNTSPIIRYIKEIYKNMKIDN